MSKPKLTVVSNDKAAYVEALQDIIEEMRP